LAKVVSSVGETVFRRIPIADIAPDTNNARQRVDGPRLQELAESLASIGQLQPVIVREDLKAPQRYRLKAGHRRRAAALLIGWTELDASVLAAKVSELDADVIALSDNLQRESLTSYEQAVAFRSLRNLHGIAGAEIGARIGKSASYVNSLLATLDNIGPVVTEQWRAGHPLATTDNLRRLSLLKDATGAADFILQADVWRRLVEGGDARPEAGRNERALFERKELGRKYRHVTRYLVAVDLYFEALKRKRGRGAPKITIAWAHSLVKFLMGDRPDPPVGMNLPALSKKTTTKDA
jgi:ParB/RepB/Spo0J family partition protein